MVDFKKDLFYTTIEALDHYGVRYKKKDDLFHLLIKLYTFLEKYIDPHKRTVCYSSELIGKLSTLPQATQEALAKLEQWVVDGMDINSFQSGGLYGDGSRDYQNALYGIVHLHLSAKATDAIPIAKERFAKRSEYVLFALFRKGIAFYIDVVHHPQALTKNNTGATEWTSSNLLKIIESNWPELLANARIAGTSMCDSDGKEIELTDEDIAKATVNGVTTFIQGNKGLYMPQMGVSTSGDNTKAVIAAQKEIHNALICQEHFLKYEDKIRTIFTKQLIHSGIPLPKEFDFHYDYIPELKNHFIVDRNTGAAFNAFTSDLYTRS